MVFLIPSAYHDPHSPFEAEQRLCRPSTNNKKVQKSQLLPASRGTLLLRIAVKAVKEEELNGADEACVSLFGYIGNLQQQKFIQVTNGFFPLY